MALSTMMKRWLLLKNVPMSRLECKNSMTKMAKIDTPFMTKLAGKKPIPIRTAHAYVAKIREYPWGSLC